MASDQDRRGGMIAVARWAARALGATTRRLASMLALTALLTASAVRAQGTTQFSVTPLFILAHGFGATVDFPLGEDLDLGVSFAFINLDNFHLQAGGLRLVRYLPSAHDDRRFYVTAGVGLGGASIKDSREYAVTGRFSGAQLLLGRKWTRESGLNCRLGVGAGYAVLAIRDDALSDHAQWFAGVMPRLEFQIGFSSEGTNFMPGGSRY